MANASTSQERTVSKYAPKIVQIQIDPDKIGDVVGQRGKDHQRYHRRDRSNRSISTTTAACPICGTDQAMMDKAVKYIKIITTDFEEGQILTGK